MVVVAYLKSDFDGLHQSALGKYGLHLGVDGGTEHGAGGTNRRRFQATSSDRGEVARQVLGDDSHNALTLRRLVAALRAPLL